MDFSMGAKNIS